MPATYEWQQHYQAALLETDHARLSKLIKAAEIVIDQRMQELRSKHDGTRAEKDAIAEALAGLNVLRREIQAA
jgi:hypothetical protein